MTKTNRMAHQIVLLAVLLISSLAFAQKRTQLLNNSAISKGKLPAHAKAQSALEGTLSPDALAASQLDLTLPNGKVVTARLQRSTEDKQKGTQSWIGSFDGAPGSTLVFSKSKGVISGFANYKDQNLELVPTGNGKHLLFNVDLDQLPKQHDEFHHNLTQAGGDISTESQVASADATAVTSGGASVVHDILVLYTGASASKYTAATLEGMITSAVQAANQAYINGGVNITLNVVALQQTTFTESTTDMAANVKALRADAEIQALRDKLAADMVVVISEDKGWCGYAELWYTWVNSWSNWEANTIVASSCLSNGTLAHEVGHLQQLSHDRATSGSTESGYNYGYRVCAADGFRDIMAYACTGANRINYFSNPRQTFNGYPMGISFESNPNAAADNVRMLNEKATEIASYRVATNVAPTAPSSLAAQSVAYNKISLAWNDNSVNETGFKVDRSTDGTNFTEIASLGAGARSYADGTVGAKMTYQYRVRAYNSYGTSAYSNTLSVTTPDAPVAPPQTAPAAPSNLTVQRAAYNKVTLSWQDNSLSETGVIVERSLDGINFSQIATLGTNTTSYADAKVAASTLYYYRVRAFNAIGSSANSNTVSVKTPAARTKGRK